jgi:NAD-dependent deacetylase
VDGLDGKAGNLNYIAVHGRLDMVTPFHDQQLAAQVVPQPAPWDQLDESDLDGSLRTLFRIEGDTPTLDYSLKPLVLLFDEVYTELYRIGEAQRRMQTAERMVFMGTSFSVNITLMALEVARRRGTPIDIVDPDPVDVGYDNTTYHRMTALEYIEREG